MYKRERERERERDIYIYIYIYTHTVCIHIYIYIFFFFFSLSLYIYIYTHTLLAATRATCSDAGSYVSLCRSLSLSLPISLALSPSLSLAKMRGGRLSDLLWVVNFYIPHFFFWRECISFKKCFWRRGGRPVRRPAESGPGGAGAAHRRLRPQGLLQMLCTILTQFYVFCCLNVFSRVFRSFHGFSRDRHVRPQGLLHMLRTILQSLTFHTLQHQTF